MEGNENSFLAYFKYEGKLVEDGYMEARKSAEALLGIDEVFKYFLYQFDKKLEGVEFEIPVRVRKGSWEALIPHSIEDWLKTAAGIGLTAYLKSAGSHLADTHFKGKTISDLLKETIKAIKWVIKISQHLKSLVIKQFNEPLIEEKNGIVYIGIKNDEGVVIFVPQKYLDLYQNCPEKLFSKLAKVVEKERELTIGFNTEEVLDKDDQLDFVKITTDDKYVFTKKEDDEQIIFPELKHNMYVELDGHVTRGNENTNTIGFEYLKHILTCLPSNGNIKIYKQLLFTNCIIKGYIDRLDEQGELNEKKPRIRFIDLIEIKKPDIQPELFPKQ